jgi:hypothetical protein
MHYFSALPLNIPYNTLIEQAKWAKKRPLKVGSSFAYKLMRTEYS